ncbi:MAG: AAA family ATPase [Bdellovibrionales bacterium]|nr:AAA family ATPase [Bdellovibrionales bacterium]
MKAFDTLEIGIREVKDILIERFLFQLKNPKDRLRPLYLEGHAGIGKTQVIHQVAALLSTQLKKPVRCQTLNLQFCERPDFMGLPRIDADRDTVFARPKILPKEGLGILFLDEANRVDSDIQSGMLTLLEDRNINGHQIGSDWMIVLAGNPAGSSGGTQYNVGDFDYALQDRIAKVGVKGSIDDLTQYLRTKYPGHPLLHILEYSPDFISFDGQGCSPRSFEYALRSTLGLSDPENKAMYRQLALELGPAAASRIF